jgi:hypothetical protein
LIKYAQEDVEPQNKKRTDVAKSREVKTGCDLAESSEKK